MAELCPVQKQNSNDSSLHVAEELCLGLLPGEEGAPVVDGVVPTWYEMEPNEYSDFGQEVTTTARAPLKANRSNLKGTPTDIDASGGWNMDVTKSNMDRLLQGFMFARAQEQKTTVPLAAPFRLAFDVADGAFVFDEPPTGTQARDFMPDLGAIVMVSGFSNPGNNGRFVISEVNYTTRTATVLPAMAVMMADESPTYIGVPPMEMHTVGFGGMASPFDIVATVVNGQLVMTGDNVLPLGQPGRWFYFGGDTTASKPGANVGYARVALDWDAESEDGVRFDLTTFTPEAGTYPGSQPVEIYVPTTIANGKTAGEILRRSYRIRRGLGYDATGVQAEYLKGAVPNEFTLNISGQSLLNADLAFVATDYETRDGANFYMPGNVVNARGEAAYNTSSNVFAVKLYIHDKATSQPSALFGYLQEGTITINNGVTPDKAVGVMGAFDTSAGNFTVGGELTAYFTTVAAAAAIRNNADVGLYNIFAADNAGFIADIPLLTLGGGRINVAKDEAITIPLTVNGAQAASLETLNLSFFKYLPDSAMPK